MTGPRRGRRATVLVMTAILLIALAPAVDARETGDFVDYRVQFPVAGKHHFWDTYWAARSHGFHHAQDLMAEKETPVLAVADGTVRFVNWSSRSNDLNPERCCSLVIRHDDGWESWYIHLTNDTTGTDDGKGWGIAQGLVPGSRVEAGQLIGWVGDSGNAESTAPHLHFELYDATGVNVNSFSALVDAGGNALAAKADPLLSGSRPLRTGSRGADVRRLQELLTGLQHGPGPVDGIFGSKTDRAVRAFQSDRGLAVDGVVGRVTRGALESTSADPERLVRVGSRGNDVRLIQDRLAASGYDPGPVDGIFGPRTELAVLAFQDDHSLLADGVVGPQSRAALGI